MMQSTNSMKNAKDDGTAVDVNLFRAIGLYRLLQPSSKCRSGNWYPKVLSAAIWLMIGLICMQYLTIFLVVKDLSLFQYKLMEIGNLAVGTFKGYTLITNADRLWDVLEAARYGFTSCGCRDPSNLRRCGHLVSIWLRRYVTLIASTITIWILAPWFVNEYVTYTKLDGTIGHYRPSVFNLWYPVTESMYNWLPVWATIYAFEVFTIDVYVICVWFFDLCFTTACVMLVGQLQTLSTAYETLGQPNCQVQPGSRSPGRRKKNEHIQLDYYNELILLIKDNENIFKKYDDLLNITRPVILLQVFGCAFSMVSLIFSIVLSVQSGLSIISVPILKLFSAYMSYFIQLYISCYLHDILETAKSTLNFELYSSNWTEMDLKFKKTMFSTMIINATHMRVIKLSPKNIVNLQLFIGVMKMSYTVVSVLLNISNEKTNMA